MDRINLLYNVVANDKNIDFFYNCVDECNLTTDVGYLVDSFDRALLINNIILRSGSKLLKLSNGKICVLKYG